MAPSNLEVFFYLPFLKILVLKTKRLKFMYFERHQPATPNFA